MKILPPAFASMVADLLGDLKGDGVENYLDDILSYSADFERHLALVKAVFACLQGGGLSVTSQSLDGAARAWNLWAW